MNEVASGELIVLQSIFFESFQQPAEDTIEFDFQSQQFNDALHVLVQFSPEYPEKAVKRLEITSLITRPQDLKAITSKLRETEQEMLNQESQPYIFQLINSIDTSEFQVHEVIVEEQCVENTLEEDTIVISVNHGEIPGQIINAQNYKSWLEEYCAQYKIELIVNEQLQPISETDSLLGKDTGYKYFQERKQQNQA